MITNVTWLVNDSLVNLPNVEESVFENENLWILTIGNIQKRLNMTRIKCLVTFNSGGTGTSPSTLLLLQGMNYLGTGIRTLLRTCYMG